jgi:hypothetical protein
MTRESSDYETPRPRLPAADTGLHRLKKPNIIYILADEKPEGSTKPHPKKRK